MTVNKALEVIQKFIDFTVTEYKLTDDSKNDAGEDIAHPLEDKVESDKLIALDFGIKDATLNTIPLTLLESNGSTATEFKKISTEEFVRLPITPVVGAELDIDESLAFAVIYKSLSFLWSGYSDKSADADGLYAGHNDVTRDYLMNRDSQEVAVKTIFFRYSIEGTEWHDTYQDGDYYISFKQSDELWSNAIKFVGDGGDGGSGVATFIELTDTPDTLTAGKFLKVNDAGDGIEETDAPTSEINYRFTGDNGVSGGLMYDLLKTSNTHDFHWILLNGDATIDISKTDDKYNIELGRVYTIEIFPEGNTCTLEFEAKGNKTIDSGSYANIVQFLFDGLDIFIINNTVY